MVKRSVWPLNPGRSSMAKPYEPRLAAIYRDEIRDQMQKQFEYKNEMQIPKIEKVVLNMGLG